ncbi:hypothetical protein [Piscinibacter sp.]|uniref:hypothetical protein n=1 Tax=Piscinibacter sp. TaxID=1903157 RepID=UPI002C60C8F7|nr:hypothetical protein [Albitalea sp.]HUG23635.1 hypothetical protein [Albitalea sp.]
MSVQFLMQAGFFAEEGRARLEDFVLNKGRVEPGRPGHVPFYYVAALQRNSDFAIESVDDMVFEPASAETDILLSGFPQAMFERLPLHDHAPCAPDADTVANTKRALSWLQSHSVDGLALVSRYVRLLVIVDRAPHVGAQFFGTLTSCSLPALPYCSFVSKKALFHLPPREIAPRPHQAWFAENIFHEALHNALTVDILAGRVFRSGFRVADSPPVSIPWRSDDPAARNRAWPVDRVLHALVVYAGIYGLRTEMLGSGLEETERHFLLKTLSSARSAMQHLAAALRSAPDCFTKAAKRAVLQLCQFVDSVDVHRGEFVV